MIRALLPVRLRRLLFGAAPDAPLPPAEDRSVRSAAPWRALAASRDEFVTRLSAAIHSNKRGLTPTVADREMQSGWGDGPSKFHLELMRDRDRRRRELEPWS